jgi:predicted permease
MLSILRRVGALLRRERLARELEEELETHRLLLAQRLRHDGMEARAADTASRRAMGNVTLAREDVRATWIAPWLEGFGQDVRYALRALTRERSFALVAIATLTAAIGLNTTIFTIFNALVLAPWPVADPSRVVTLQNTSADDVRARGGGAPGGFSFDEIDYFREHSRTLAGIAAIRSGGGDLTVGDDDTPASWVSGNYFSLLGVEMVLGRGFLPQEDDAASPSAVAVLSFGYWTRALARDPAVIGRTLVLDDVPFTVVGVTAERFTGTSPNRVDVWLPMASTRLVRPDDRWTRSVYQPRACCVRVAARLAPGVDRAAAEAELALLDTRYRSAAGAQPGGVRVAGTAFAEENKTNTQSAFAPVLLAVLLVLSLACANVGNLLLARATARRREIAVRLSLGASRGRIVRQLLTESLVLGVIAGALGLAVAFWAPSRLMTLLVPSSGVWLAPDGIVLAFSALLSLVSCAMFGLLPALHGSRTGVSNALKDGSLPRLGGLSFRNALLGLQVAIAVVLVSAAGLLTRATFDANARPLGFSMDGLSTVAFAAPSRGYDAGRIRQLAVDMAAAAQPLVASGHAALTSTPPLASGNLKGSFRLPGGTDEEPNQVYEVSPGYFALLNMPIADGRALGEGDADSSAIVVNETFARTYWPGSSAVGRTIVVDARGGGWNTPGELRIVGVVRDASMYSLTSVDPTIYQTLSGRTLPQVIVRDWASASVVGLIGKLDDKLKPRVHRLSDNLLPLTRRSRVAAIVASVLGSLSLLLACVGMAGVFAYVVQQRTREIGIRMALGARSMDVVRVVVRSSLLAIGAGVVAGAAGSVLSSTWLRSLLLGLSPIDPLAHGSVLIVLACAALAATFLPARRASRIAPVDALRNE